jgi:hypothetical protein
MSRPVVALALVLLGPAVAAAQARAPLAWKWHTGEQFTLSVATAYEEQITIAGKQWKNKAKTSIAFDVTVLAVTRNGTVALDLRVTSFQVEGSRNAEAITKVGKAIKGDNFTVTFDPEMKSQQFGGVGALAKKVSEQEGEPAALALVEKTLTMLFRNLIQEAFVPMPGKATAKGDAWEQMSDLEFALGLGTLTTTKTFTDEDKASADGKEVRKVGIQGVLKFVPPKADGAGAFTLEKFDLKKQQYRGTLYFDPAAGRPVSSDTRVLTELTMKLRVDGQRFNGEATREQTFQIRFGAKRSPGLKR